MVVPTGTAMEVRFSRISPIVLLATALSALTAAALAAVWWSRRPRNG